MKRQKAAALAWVLIMAFLLVGCGVEYTVSFDLDEGELISGELTQTVPEGEPATAPETAREGYQFIGWDNDFSSVAAEMTIKAIWKKLYLVSFELDGGTLLSGQLAQTVLEGTAAQAPQAERAGYEFKGWDTEFESVSSDLKVKALWRPLYTVSFDLDGGNLLSGQLTQIIPEESAAQLPEASKDSFLFVGWDKEASYVTADMVVKALWKQLYSVIFELDGGTLISGQLSQTVPEGGAATAPSAQKEGYIFNIWDTRYDNISQNTTVKALWKKLHNVEFNLGGGTRTGGGTLKQVVVDGESAWGPLTERTGYVFAGWNDIITAVYSDMVVTALWKKLHAVSFDLAGGSRTGGGELSQTVVDGDRAAEPLTSRSGYLFLGWSDSFSSINSDKTIKALWAKLYTVEFDLAGGAHTGGGALVQTIAEGASAVPPSAAKENYTLKGWSASYNNVTADLKITAVWTEAKLTAEELYELCMPATVEITGYYKDGDVLGMGTGFFIESGGVILTNYHVINEAYSAKVKLSDGKEYDVIGVIAYDIDRDLAIIKIDAESPAVLLPTTRGVKTGETVYAIGSPFGLTGSLSSGIVSSASRNEDGINMIQTTTPISPGNSGGPLVNAYGEALGVNTYTYSDGQNLNFAVSITEVDNLVRGETQTLEAVAIANRYYDVDPFEIMVQERESNNTLFTAQLITQNGATVSGEVGGPAYNFDEADVYRVNVKKDQEITIVLYFDSESDFYNAGMLLTSDSTEKAEDIIVGSPYQEGDCHIIYAKGDRDESIYIVVLPIENGRNHKVGYDLYIYLK